MKPGIILSAVIFLSGISSIAFAEKKLAATAELTEGNNKFAIDLYSKLKSEEGNVFFSPYSISTCLGMVYAGARENTEKQMAQVLHFTEGQEKTCKSFGSLQGILNTIQEKENIKLGIANSIWAKENYKFLQSYLDLVQKDYKSKINLAPFDSGESCEKTRIEINTWVEGKTNDKIKDLIMKGILDNMTRMVLVNAIYFKGDWETQFKETSTNKNGIFYTSPEKKVTLHMMYQSGEFNYTEDKSTLVLEMPYKGKETSMVILLPRAKDGITGLERSMTYDKLQRLLNKMSKQKVEVHFPKFKIETKYELNKTLPAMGMSDAFREKSDFSGMDGGKNLFISNVIHKAFIEVDEKGTEAAAATVVIMKGRSISRKNIFRADHPFIYMIRENSTGSILFMGRMSNPGK